MTGYDVILWLERGVATEGFAPPQTIRVHSANASAALKMESGIAAVRRLAGSTTED